MITPKQLGIKAKQRGINVPSLDETFAKLLLKIDAEKKIEHLTQWWEGWYEAFDEAILMQQRYFTPAYARA